MLYYCYLFSKTPMLFIKYGIETVNPWWTLILRLNVKSAEPSRNTLFNNTVKNTVIRPYNKMVQKKFRSAKGDGSIWKMK